MSKQKKDIHLEYIKKLLKKDKQLKRYVIEELIREGSIDRESARDFLIPILYDEYQAEGMRAKEAREKLSDEFNTGLKNIERILYLKNSYKKRK